LLVESAIDYLPSMQVSRCFSIVPLIVLAASACRSGPNALDSDAGRSGPTAQAAAASPAGKHGSCRVRAPGPGATHLVPFADAPPTAIRSCIDYVGSMFTPEYAPQACGEGQYSTDPCPTQGRIGSCAMYEGDPKATIVRHYGGGKTTVDVRRTACPGRWIPD
jgi:hypothetical protein